MKMELKRDNKGKFLKGHKGFWLGKYHSDNDKKKMKMIAKEKGYGKWMNGKHHSEKTKEKMTLAKQNISEETRKKLRKNHKGMMGKHHSVRKPL